MEDYYYVPTEDMLNSDEIISSIVKTQTLNVIKLDLETLLNSTTNKRILDTIKYNLLILDDCYVIDMYKFQFKAIIDIIQKEIKNIKEVISLEL